MIEFGSLDEWCSRRPTASILYAVLYVVAGQSLTGFYTAVAVLLAGVMAFTVHQITKAWGLAAAACFCCIVFGAYADKAGTFMTESGGLILGALAVGVLIRGFTRNSFLLSVFGVCSFALAVFTRAGALLAIPLIALQLLIAQHQSIKKTRVNALQLALGLVCFFGSIYAAERLVAHPKATFQGNFSYTLYGLASGGKGWTHVLTEHASALQGLSDGQMSKKVYELAFAKILAEPSVVISGLSNALTTHLMNPIPLFYPFSPGFGAQVWFILLIFGLGILLTGRPQRRYPGFLLFGALGVILSAPFLADGGPRVLVATVPLVAAIVAFAIGKLGGVAQYPPLNRPTSVDAIGMSPVALLLIVLVVAPVAFRLTGTPPLPKTQATNEHVVKLERGSGIRILPDGEVSTRRRDRPVSELRSQRSVKEMKLAPHLQAGNYLANGLNLDGTGHLFLLFDREPKFEGTVRLRITGENLNSYTVRVASMEAL